MTVFLIIAFIVLLLARIFFGAYVDVVPAFAPLLTPLTWITVGIGAFALVFTIAKLYKIIKGGKE